MNQNPDHADGSGKSVDTHLASIDRFVRQGQYLRAYDAAEIGLQACPDEVRLRYQAVLALARAGSCEVARRQYFDYGLVT